MVLYSIFAFFDYAVYSMVRFCMRLIILIANYNFFDENAIGDIARKVYVVLGVLMLFKMVIVAIQYMINPDTFDDKEKGMTGLLTKMAVTMALLVLIDPIFKFAIYMQQSIVSSIPGIILDSGENYSLNAGEQTQGVSGGKGVLDEIGDRVAGTTISAFVTEKTDRVDDIKKKGETMDWENSNNQRLEMFRTNITSGCSGKVIPFEALDVNKCNYDYMFGLSTAAGLFLLYVMLSMTIDIGIRSIKLGILQMLAPIPISSYIVSKDKLKKFVKISTSVYVDLFARLGVVYFIIFFVKKVIESMDNGVKIGNYTASGFETAFVKIAIIIALFMFAKNAPKFICEVLGINGDGFGDMKDMFKRGSGLFGTTAAGLRTARSNYTAQKERALGKNPNNKVGARLRGALSAAAGFGSATGRGLAMTAQGKGFKDVRKGATSAALAARNKRSERVDKLYNRNSMKDILKGTRTPRSQYATDENGRMKGRLRIGKHDFANTKLAQSVRNWSPTNKFTEALQKGATYALHQTEKNPEYYGYMDYRRDVRREKLGIPSAEGFVKSRYDAMQGIAKMAADAKGHGVGKMNETPDRYKVSITGTEAGRTISSALGFSELTMEQVRNMYAMAKNGQMITKSDGRTRVTLSDAEITALGSLVQNVEKRTSYLKEAELMAIGDPAASPNVDKLVIGIQSNKDMFSSKDIMTPIMNKMEKNLNSYRVSTDETSADYHKFVIEGQTYDLSKLDYDGVLNLTKRLHGKLPDVTDSKYAGMSDADKKLAVEADTRLVIEQRADILTGIKDAFEEVAKQQYKPAQVADNRAQKAQQAINNNEKKG